MIIELAWKLREISILTILTFIALEPLTFYNLSPVISKNSL